LKNPNLEPLTPEQMIEYIEIFHLQCDKTTEQILAGEEYSLIATEETADLLFRINFLTNGLHGEPSRYYPFGSTFPLKDAGEEFSEVYLIALTAKDKYTGYLTAHWGREYPFLRVEHVECYPAEMYWFYISIPEEILRRIYIEQNGMSLPQYLDFIVKYILVWDKGPWLEYDGTGNLVRYENVTDNRIAYLSELFWTDPEFYREKELMQEYGLSDENPMTFEWVISHPEEAYTLVTTTWDAYDRFPATYRLLGDNYFVMRGIPILPEDSEW